MNIPLIVFIAHVAVVGSLCALTSYKPVKVVKEEVPTSLRPIHSPVVIEVVPDEEVATDVPKKIEVMGTLGWYGKIYEKTDEKFQRNEQEVVVELGPEHFNLTWCCSVAADAEYKIFYNWDRQFDSGKWNLQQRKNKSYEIIQTGNWRLEEVVHADKGMRRFVGWRRTRENNKMSPPIYMRLEFPIEPK